MKKPMHITTHHRLPVFIGLLLLLNSCQVFDQAAHRAVDQALTTAVEREVEAMMTDYSDAMLYQLAYTQMFHMGGYGLHHRDFEEGQGAVWHIESTENGETTSFRAERALLEYLEDGSAWWYLSYTPENEDAIEYEMLVDSSLHALEMYIKDPEDGEIRHHEFARGTHEDREMQESEASLEEAGYQTETYYPEDRENYRVERVTLTIGSGSFDAELLEYQDEQGNFNYRWWVTETVPGELIQYRYEDGDTGSSFHGELIEMQENYGFTLRTDVREGEEG